jgi:hypothetical protein
MMLMAIRINRDTRFRWAECCLSHHQELPPTRKNVSRPLGAGIAHVR